MSRTLETNADPIYAELAAAAEAHSSALARIEGLSARLDVLEHAQTTPPEFNIVDAGCVPNDPDFDNGLVLNALLALTGNDSRGRPWPDRVMISLYIPGGAWYFKTPLATPHRTGLRIRGNGSSIAYPEGEYREGRLAGPASRLVYRGPADQAALTLNGLGTIIDGIVLQDGVYGDARRDGSIGLVVAGRRQPPTGKHELRNLSLLNWDTGIFASSAPDNTHADETTVGYCWAQSCRRVFACDNLQAVCWHWQSLIVRGRCEVVWDYGRGGDLVCDSLSLCGSDTLLVRCSPDNNYANYVITNVKFDNTSAGWRLVEATRPVGSLRVRVAGMMGLKAQPGPRPVVVPQTADLGIDIGDCATRKPWVWKAEMPK